MLNLRLPLIVGSLLLSLLELDRFTLDLILPVVLISLVSEGLLDKRCSRDVTRLVLSAPDADALVFHASTWYCLHRVATCRTDPALKRQRLVRAAVTAQRSATSSAVVLLADRRREHSD